MNPHTSPTERLLPCPFCGSVPLHDYPGATLIWHPDHSNCPLSATYFRSEAWNTRIESMPAPEEVERAGAAIARVLDELCEEARDGKYAATDADEPTFRKACSERLARAAIASMSSPCGTKGT